MLVRIITPCVLQLHTLKWGHSFNQDTLIWSGIEEFPCNINT